MFVRFPDTFSMPISPANPMGFTVKLKILLMFKKKGTMKLCCISSKNPYVSIILMVSLRSFCCSTTKDKGWLKTVPDTVLVARSSVDASTNVLAMILIML